MRRRLVLSHETTLLRDSTRQRALKYDVKSVGLLEEVKTVRFGLERHYINPLFSLPPYAFEIPRRSNSVEFFFSLNCSSSQT